MFCITPLCSGTKTPILEEQFPAAGTVWESLELENWQNSMHWFYTTYSPLEISAARLPRTVLETAALHQYQQRRWCSPDVLLRATGNGKKCQKIKPERTRQRLLLAPVCPRSTQAAQGACSAFSLQTTALLWEVKMAKAALCPSFPSTPIMCHRLREHLPLQSTSGCCLWPPFGGEGKGRKLHLWWVSSLQWLFCLRTGILQNPLMYISSAATPGNGCLPSRKTVFRQKPRPLYKVRILCVT